MTSRCEVTQLIEPKVTEKIHLPLQASTYYGVNTFSEVVMQKMISEKTFCSFKKWQDGGPVISSAQADEIALAMKDWAINKGATAYTHWFQPMTGLTAEKHDAFISISSVGSVIEKFSGSKLIQGEPDASSFPSGGIRATFEARGYTAWDPSSPAFITEVDNGKTLCIPTIFVSYTGEALDKKLPLLRSDAAINKVAIDLLKLFGHNDVSHVYSTCGPEQEYFLVDEAYYRMRSDLLLTGRTLLGAPSPKGQQLEDQYFGSIKDRVLNYMHDVSVEAYKLGIPVTTKHNEVAPHQYEFAPIFEPSNLAADHNQLLMDIMKRVAHRHGLVCLLHEKPFAGVNGSGKHVNWSLSDSKGNNLLNPGDTPQVNLLFLTVLSCVIHAVYTNSDILRAAIASAGNEHRLGANEAPPAIISVFLGEQLTNVVNMIESGKFEKAKPQDLVDLGVKLLPKFIKDTTDRNRTSPFAFTGAKFEFRACGSSMNISTSLAVINTIVADSMAIVAERIRAETAKGGEFSAAVLKVLSGVIKESRAILFEGNNYSDEWKKEAQKRGLPNVASTPEALKAFVTPKAISMFERHGVFSKVELQARYIIWLEAYEKMLDIEAKTLIDIVKTQILPPAYEYQADLASGFELLKGLNDSMIVSFVDGALEDRKEVLTQLTADIYYIRKNIKELEAALNNVQSMALEARTAFICKDVKEHMAHIRRHVDALEQSMSDSLWSLPKYREMLFIS
ncbi:MAG: glutamine synthetase III [Chitinispirillaceae bacterium]|nr:glutamine synthetase III [Chitinispirillaceae bacterium]